jgi:hypothetical protein
MVSYANQNTRRSPVNRGDPADNSKPNKIGVSTPFDFIVSQLRWCLKHHHYNHSAASMMGQNTERPLQVDGCGGTPALLREGLAPEAATSARLPWQRRE